MSTKKKSSQVQMAERLEGLIRTFAEETQTIERPSDGATLLRLLDSMQVTLADVYEALARWYGDARHGIHHAGDGELAASDNPSWIRAGLALEEAGQYGRDAGAALDRARAADEVALWFDEVVSDEPA